MALPFLLWLETIREDVQSSGWLASHATDLKDSHPCKRGPVDWGHGSSGRVLASKALSSNPSMGKKKKKRWW
jgi:hypothetical protein